MQESPGTVQSTGCLREVSIAEEQSEALLVSFLAS